MNCLGQQDGGRRAGPLASGLLPYFLLALLLALCLAPGLALAQPAPEAAPEPAPASPAAQRPAEGASPEDEKALAEELKANDEALRRIAQEASSALEELEKAEAQLRQLQQEATRAEAQLRVAAAKVGVASRAEEQARTELVARLDELAPRLRARYRLGKYGRVGVLLSSRSVADLLRRKRLLDHLLASDLELLKDSRQLFDQLSARRAELEAVRVEHSQVATRAQERRAAARRRQESLASLHDSLVEQKSTRHKLLAELQARQAQLGRLVADLRPEPEPERPQRPEAPAERPLEGLNPFKGKLPFPTQGFVEVGFGKVLNARFNTVTHQNGIDIRASEGTEVVCVSPGKVVHAGAFKGYGNLVIVDHGEGFHTLYAHLAAITRQVGEAVELGDVLGLVGDTGSLKGAYLYFEIREKGKPVNPKGWFGSRPGK